jgi:hypothetical protein
VTGARDTARRRLLIRRVRITGWTALSFLLTTIVGFLAWAHVVYPADRAATIEVYQSGTVIVENDPRAIIISPASDAISDEVVVFYPGGRVDPWAYLPPLAHTAHTLGVRVVIPKPPLNLAIADTRDIGSLASLAGTYDSIIAAGHSLGGVRGCINADDSRVSHLVLFASYCANDLTHRDTLRVLTILGINDGLTDRNQVDTASILLPRGAGVVSIRGANHASFGAYGPQAGDGPSEISPQAMTEELTKALATFLQSSD